MMVPMPPTAATGIRRLFGDQTFHFQALRVLNDVAAGGADVNEVFETISHIAESDAEAWYEAFSATARRNEDRVRDNRDPISRGLGLQRAHTYWRTAEFLLSPDDPRREIAWSAQISNFDAGLQALGVPFERSDVPYEKGSLRAIFYPVPGGDDRPLIVFVGGYDSTLEELYFMLAKDANDRGYNVLTYEGPGQGAALRRHGLPFTHEWEKPNGAVLDHFLARHAQPRGIVLIGMSMGGYLAPRAAAFDQRIDGLIAFDVLFDFGALCKTYGALAADPVKSRSPGVKWAMENGCWTFGVGSVEAFLAASAAYTLAPVAHKIGADVLVLAGAADHFVPLSQVDAFTTALKQARSVETHIYDQASGGAEHCQLGATTLWHATLFDWMLRRFGS
ncbi:alpha/beta fold hydrolase [Nitrospirillum sp. BR 11752]|uniref:alpha/beta hydrolase family protein n=1 Tax=Nitrospirillum sp. BR 11752 TaxID=3104293 RepID=UPI002EA22A44|nr:alpha/beta fold hydrolase [Nitrospirillum sp. BR 11752]